MRKFTIEIGNDMNCDIMWGPNKDLLRGRYERANNPSGVTYAPGFTDIPDIPGLHVTIDSTKMEATIADPLNDPKNVELLASISRAHKATFKEEVGPVADRTIVMRTKDSLATWINAAQRAVESKHARLVNGSFPKELPGTPEKEMFRAVPKRDLQPHED